MMKKSIMLCLTGGVLAASAVVQAFTLQPGFNEFAVRQQLNGEEVLRKVVIQAPDDLRPKRKYPVIMVFHGYGGYVQNAVDMMSNEVNQHQFIGVYPQGYDNSWNLGSTTESSADDMDFVDQIFAKLQTMPQVMNDEVFAMGMSNGASLVNKLAVEREYLKGVAAMSSPLISGLEPADSVTPVSVMEIRGMQDNVVPYGGGYAEKVQHTFLSMEDTLAFWGKNNQCQIGPKTATTENGDEKISYSDCKDNTQVVGYACPDCGHSITRDLEGGLVDLVVNFFNERKPVFQMGNADVKDDHDYNHGFVLSQQQWR